MDVSLPGCLAACSTADGGDVVEMVRTLFARLARSADADVVFGSLAEAYSSYSGAECVVELSIPTGSDQREDRNLLAAGTDVATGPDWVAVRIPGPAGAETFEYTPAVEVGGSSVEPLTGYVVCRHPGSPVTPAEVEALRLAVAFATGVVREERGVARVENEAATLRVALASNREIGTAIGIVMSTRLVPENEAFALLVQTSQQQHRNLREVATEVIVTGALTSGPTSTSTLATTSTPAGTLTGNGAGGALQENERGTV